MLSGLPKHSQSLGRGPTKFASELCTEQSEHSRAPVGNICRLVAARAARPSSLGACNCQAVYRRSESRQHQRLAPLGRCWMRAAEMRAATVRRAKKCWGAFHVSSAVQRGEHSCTLAHSHIRTGELLLSGARTHWPLGCQCVECARNRRPQATVGRLLASDWAALASGRSQAPEAAEWEKRHTKWPADKCMFWRPMKN